MRLTKTVKKILANYEGVNPGVKTNLSRVLMSGKLGGTGKMVILPVDQGFEHGPERSFEANPPAYDPHYHYKLAIDAGLNAYAAPLGMIEAGADSFAGEIPTILKVNSSNSLYIGGTAPHQACTASVRDAIRLGCVGIGFTIYPGSDSSLDMFEEIAEMAREAKESGLIVVIWSYPRGGNLSKIGETAIDICSYAAHIAAMLGAHIIKVKPPISALENVESAKVYDKYKIPVASLQERIKIVVRSCFDGRRLVVFSGGNSKNDQELYDEVRQIHRGGGNGSIIGRNSFQRPRDDALKMLNNIVNIYKERV